MTGNEQLIGDLEELAVEANQKTRLDYVSIIIALILAAIGIGIALAPDKPGGFNKTEWFFTFITIPICFIFQSQLERKRQLHRIEKQLILVKKETKRSADYSNINAKHLDLLDRLSGFDEVMQSTGFFALRFSLLGIRFSRTDNLIEVKGRDSSVNCYQHFWNKINNKIAFAPSGSESPIARITHASDVGVWYHEQARKIKDLHNEFAKHGLVFRIMIDNGVDENGSSYRGGGKDKISSYVDLMEIFVGRSANDQGNYVAYINTKMIKDFSAAAADHDFCIVSRLRYSVEWALSAGRRVKTFTLRSNAEAYRQYMQEWSYLVSCVRSMEYKEEVFGVNTTYLNLTKEKFLEKLDILQGPPHKTS